jgi:hypothetical protein
VGGTHHRYLAPTAMYTKNLLLLDRVISHLGRPTTGASQISIALLPSRSESPFPCVCGRVRGLASVFPLRGRVIIIFSMPVFRLPRLRSLLCIYPIFTWTSCGSIYNCSSFLFRFGSFMSSGTRPLALPRRRSPSSVGSRSSSTTTTTRPCFTALTRAPCL